MILPASQYKESTVTMKDPWYALRVRSNFERTAASALRERGFEEHLPVYRSHRSWSDRKKEVDLPLFPGYVFCRFSLRNRLPILSAPGVLHIVGLGRTPQPVDEQEILAVQELIRSGLPATPWPFLRTGQWVVIERGPLAGMEGILVAFKNTTRLVLSVSLLQRSISAEVGGDCVRPIRQPHTARVA